MGTRATNHRRHTTEDPNAPGVQSLVIGLDATTSIHATIPGGGAVNVTTGFTPPDLVNGCDRGCALALAGGGTPATYVVTGTYDGAVVSDNITTVAGSTVYGDQPFDTYTSIVGADPVANLDMYLGDVWIKPACRAVEVGVAGDIVCLLDKDADTQTAQTHTVPQGDWQRAVRFVDISATTATTLHAIY